MPTETLIAKWGHSLAVRLPQAIAKEARLAEGDRLSLELDAAGGIVLRPTRRRYRLDQLTSRITAKNRHSETDWGTPAGKESW
jgi:antitoxin MazE